MKSLFGDQNRIVNLLDRDASKDGSALFIGLSEKTTDAVQHPLILVSGVSLQVAVRAKGVRVQ